MEYLRRPIESPSAVTAEIKSTVSRIIADIEREGMVAARRYSEQFDGWAPESFRVSGAEIERARLGMNEEVAQSARFLIDQVTGFARLQRETLVDFEAETLPGVLLGQRHIPVASVGARGKRCVENWKHSRRWAV